NVGGGFFREPFGDALTAMELPAGFDPSGRDARRLGRAGVVDSHGVLGVDALPIDVFAPAADLPDDEASGGGLHLADQLVVRAGFLRLRALCRGRLGELVGLHVARRAGAPEEDQPGDQESWSHGARSIATSWTAGKSGDGGMQRLVLRQLAEGLEPSADF